MKFVSWNVNGIRAIFNKGFEEIFNSFDADFFCLQETKMQEGQFDFSPAGYGSISIMLRRKAIQVPRFIHVMSRFRFDMASISMSMTMKVVS